MTMSAEGTVREGYSSLFERRAKFDHADSTALARVMVGGSMGWDAYALKDGEALEEVDTPQGRELANPHLRRAFWERDAEVKRLSGHGAFVLGILFGSFEEMFERGVGVRFDDAMFPESEVVWSPERVRQAQAEADWDFPRSGEDADEEWRYWTARTFLETCAAEGLGIRFSW